MFHFKYNKCEWNAHNVHTQTISIYKNPNGAKNKEHAYGTKYNLSLVFRYIGYIQAVKNAYANMLCNNG